MTTFVTAVERFVLKGAAMQGRSRAGRRVALAGCAAAAIAVLAAAPPPKAAPEVSAPPPVLPATGKPLTLLEVALVAAENRAIPRVRREENMTWQSSQLPSLSRLLARAGRDDEALRLIRDLDTAARVKVPAYAPLAVAALRRGDQAKASAHVERIIEMAEWTSAGALAEVALAMDAAGDHAGAAQLAARITRGRERADTFVALRRYPEAVTAAREIEGDMLHVPCGDGQCWRYFYDGRQQVLLSLIEKLVDLGELAQARKAMEAFAEVDDYAPEVWRARALLLISRREDAKSTLRAALDEAGNGLIEFPGDRVKRAVLLADIAARFAEAGEQNLAIAQLPKALAAIGPIDSIQTAELSVTQLAEAVSHVARAYFALGQRDQAVSLLAQIEGLANAWPVPPPEKNESSSWDSTGAAEHDRIESKLRVAAELEVAGETQRAEKVLASALAETAAMRGKDWREYPWQSLVQIYGEVGRLDRAVTILTAGPTGNEDKWLAISELTSADLAPPVRAQIWGLLDSLPPGLGKADLAGRLAARFAELGEQSNATRLVSEALASLAAAVAAAPATGEVDWPLTLVELGGTAPGAERPGNAEQQRWLRELMAAASVKGPELHAKRPQ